MEIIKSENYEIYKLENSIYKIHFHYAAYSLVSSLVKSRLIMGSSTDETYTTITFKAESVKTLKQYLQDNEVRTGKQSVLISDVSKMIRSLVMQLSYLITKTSSTIIGYTPENIIVINDEKFAFLGSDFVANFDEVTEMAMISCPFSPKDFFFSPEIIRIKEIPSYIHYKSSYFSLACLIIYALLGDDEFYKEYLRHKQIETIIEYIDNHPIKQTKIYWLLSRCLVEQPNNRSILLI
jgi:serine/threonine protein kinase